MKYFPNIPGEHYHIGRLELDRTIPENVNMYHGGSPIRFGPEVGFVLYRIPYTLWILWWRTN